MIRSVNEDDSQAVLERALEGVLRPLCRLLLRHSYPFKGLEEVAKRVYIDVAMKDFPIAGRRQTTSRVAVLSGLTRKEVGRVCAAPTGGQVVDMARYRPITRVLDGWARDADFCDASGAPRVLELGGDTGFAGLVKRYSRDMPASAVRDELLRTGAIQRHGDRLKVAPSIESRPDARPNGESLSRDLADMTKAIDANLHRRAGPSMTSIAPSHLNRRSGNLPVARNVHSDSLAPKQTSRLFGLHEIRALDSKRDTHWADSKFSSL